MDKHTLLRMIEYLSESDRLWLMGEIAAMFCRGCAARDYPDDRCKCWNDE